MYSHYRVCQLLYCLFIRDDQLCATELTAKLEPAFLCGLRCSQVHVRSKFFEVRYRIAMYNGTPLRIHHWDPSNCPDFRGVLNSGVVLYRITCITIKQESFQHLKCVCIEGFH